MEIVKKLAAKNKDVYACRPATIAFFGDSVTQGCFEIYQTSETSLETVYEQEHAYHSVLKTILAEIFPASPTVMVNAGISGDNATQALSRLDRDVLSYKPDLVVICFGLNDCASGMGGLDTYGNSMQRIIERVKESGAEVIVMTPCTVADHLSVHTKNMGFPFVTRCVEGIIELGNAGVLDAYVNRARAVADKCGVPVCDAYDKWMKLKDYGADTTELLANKVNHPSRKMHELFAGMLLLTMLEN